MNRNLDLRSELREVEAKVKAEGQVAEGKARMKRMSEDLRGCMLSTKEALDAVLAEAGPAPSRALPEADAGAFTEWLRAKVGVMVPIISHVGDFGAFAVALGVARSFQHKGYNHVPALGRPPHRFPLVDEVRRSDEACQNVAKRFVSKFWMKGGHVLAAEKAAATRAEVFVCWVFRLVGMHVIWFVLTSFFVLFFDVA